MKRLHGWQTATLGEVSKIGGGSGFPDLYQGSTSGDFPFIKVSDLNLPGNERNVIHANNWVTEDVRRKLKAKVQPSGSIVFAKVGGAMLTNKRRILTRPTIIDNNMMALQAEGVDQHYLYQFMLTVDLGRYRQEGAVPSVNGSRVGEIVIDLPPLSEQRKIADILTTWDEALTQLDALIEAQERRKKALMQQLLTGRRRLKGFSKPWKYMRMDAVFERVDRAIEGEAEHVLSITAGRGFVDQREKFSRVIAGRNIENYVRLKKGEFSYNKGNSDRYPQGCVYRLEEFEEGAVPNVWISFRLRSETDSPLFYKHFFLYGGLNHGLHRLINAGVRNDGLLNLTASNFFSVLVPTAEPAEQAKLGTLFENLTIEVKNLRDQRRAIEQQKRGLMQRMLTGKLRVRPS